MLTKLKNHKSKKQITKNYPIFPMSQTLEKRTLDALRQHKKGKSKKILQVFF